MRLTITRRERIVGCGQPTSQRGSSTSGSRRVRSRENLGRRIVEHGEQSRDDVGLGFVAGDHRRRRDRADIRDGVTDRQCGGLEVVELFQFRSQFVPFLFGLVLELCSDLFVFVLHLAVSQVVELPVERC